MFLQWPHQGAYHITRLGRVLSSSTRCWKFSPVRYSAGLASQSLGRGSLKDSLGISPATYLVTKSLRLSSVTGVSSGLYLTGAPWSFMVTILMLGKVSLLILCLTPRNSSILLWSSSPTSTEVKSTVFLNS